MSILRGMKDAWVQILQRSSAGRSGKRWKSVRFGSLGLLVEPAMKLIREYNFWLGHLPEDPEPCASGLRAFLILFDTHPAGGETRKR